MSDQQLPEGYELYFSNNGKGWQFVHIRNDGTEVYRGPEEETEGFQSYEGAIAAAIEDNRTISGLEDEASEDKFTLVLTKQELEDLEHHVRASDEDYQHCLKMDVYDDKEQARDMGALHERVTPLLSKIEEPLNVLASTKAEPFRFEIEEDYEAALKSDEKPAVGSVASTAIAIYSGLLDELGGSQGVDNLCHEVLGLGGTDLYCHLAEMAYPIEVLYLQVASQWDMEVWDYFVGEVIGAWIARVTNSQSTLPVEGEVYAKAIEIVRTQEVH